MAEAHPVAFQWVMEAKARGATVVHVDPHYSRTSALADLFVPLRAGTDIAFLGGVINHVLADRVGLPRVRGRLHQRADDRRRGVRGRRRRRAVLRLRPGDAAATTRSLAVRGRVRRRGVRPARPGGRACAAAPARREPGRARPRGEPQLDPDAAASRAASGRSSSATTPRYTPEMVERVCGVPPELFAHGLRAVRGELGPRAHRRRSCTASAGRSTRSARSTSAPRRSCSCCSATWAGPAAA